MSTKYTASCDCGWTGTYDSQAKAAWLLRRHSCEKHRAELARAERVVARKTASGPKRDCTCKYAHHEHGTPNSYVVDRCRCRACKDANNERRNRQNKNKAYGRVPYIDATPAREHLQALVEQGMGPKRIAAVSGVGHGVISAILYGKHLSDGRVREPNKRITRHTHKRVLAITLDLADGARVDPIGTSRRLKALHTLGWGINAVARHTGLDRQCLDNALHQRATTTMATHRAVTNLYEQLWDVPAPTGTKGERVAASRAKARAAKHGWAPPLAWDDESIDDPAATPFVDELADRRTTKGTGAVNADSLTDCAIEWGMTLPQAADRLNVSRSSIEHSLRRLDDPGLADTLRAAFARNATAQGHDRPTRDGLGLRPHRRTA